MLSYVIAFAAVALFPTALAAIGAHLATLAINDSKLKFKVILLVWTLAVIGVALAGLQQIEAYRSDLEHDSKISDLQNAANGLQVTANTSLQRQEYMRGQLDSISVMIGKVGEKSSDPVIGQLAGAIAKISDRQSSDARAIVLSAIHLAIDLDGQPLNGQIVVGKVTADGKNIMLPEIQTKNFGSQPADKVSARLYLSKTLAGGGAFWQPTTSDEEGFPLELFEGGAVSINPQETWNTNAIVFSLDKLPQEPIRTKLKVFYGADHPVEATFMFQKP
jgi:hypothetical protein